MNEVERLERTIARQEDTIHRSTVNILRLIAEIDRLSKPAGSPWDAANAAKEAAHRARAALVQNLTAQGKSIAKIHLETGISTRHIPRLRRVKL